MRWNAPFVGPIRCACYSPPILIRLAPVLQITHRVIATFLIQQAGLPRTEAHTGAVTLIEEQGMTYRPTPIQISRSSPCNRQPAPTTEHTERVRLCQRFL